MSATTMLCAYCCTVRRWPDDFPVSHYARCRNCTPAPRPSLWKRARAWLASALGAGTKERP